MWDRTGLKDNRNPKLLIKRPLPQLLFLFCIRKQRRQPALLLWPVMMGTELLKLPPKISTVLWLYLQWKCYGRIKSSMHVYWDVNHFIVNGAYLQVSITKTYCPILSLSIGTDVTMLIEHVLLLLMGEGNNWAISRRKMFSSWPPISVLLSLNPICLPHASPAKTFELRRTSIGPALAKCLSAFS